MGDFGVGMPASIKLDEFGVLVESAFDAVPYLVGSALKTTRWRDVDVRVLLPDADYEKLFGDPRYPHSCLKWCALVRAFSALGKEMTGLPIDFQIQHQSYANAQYPGNRSAIGQNELRYVNPPYKEYRAEDLKKCIEVMEKRDAHAFLQKVADDPAVQAEIGKWESFKHVTADDLNTHVD